jgi:hypothetical protein
MVRTGDNSVHAVKRDPLQTSAASFLRWTTRASSVSELIRPGFEDRFPPISHHAHPLLSPAGPATPGELGLRQCRRRGNRDQCTHEQAQHAQGRIGLVWWLARGRLPTLEGLVEEVHAYDLCVR